MSQDSSSLLVAYREAWLNSIRASIGADGPGAPALEPLDEGVVDSAEASDICWLQMNVSGTVSGRQALGTPRGSVKDLARLVGPEESETDSTNESVIDDPLQVLADRVGPLIAAEMAMDIRFTASGSAAPDWTPSASSTWQIDTGKTEPILLTLSLDDALENALDGGPRASSEASDITVNMLRDVRIPTSMRLGEAELTLSEVLAFGAGGAQAVDPPYGKVGELAVGGTVVARGEIVLVGGNYGLRITELENESARLAMLRDGDLVG